MTIDKQEKKQYNTDNPIPFRNLSGNGDNAKATTHPRKTIQKDRKDLAYIITTHIYNNFAPGERRKKILSLLKEIRDEHSVFGWAVVYDAICDYAGMTPQYTINQWISAYKKFKTLHTPGRPVWSVILDVVKKYAETNYKTS